jgi:hypothetical protein
MNIIQLALSLPGYDDLKTPSQIPNGDFTSSGNSVIQNSITLVLILGVVLATLFIVCGGIKWIMSGGDKNKVQSARNTIVYSILGLLLMLLSFFIVNVVANLFGVKDLV